MKRIVAVILISLLVAPPASAGQKPAKPLDWEKLKGLRAGTEIMLTVADGQATKVKLLFADDSILVTLKPTEPKLPNRVERPLLEVGSSWPAILEGVKDLRGDRVRVSPEGIFDGDQKVADLADVIQWAPRTDVLAVAEVSEVPHSHWIRNIFIAVGIIAAAIVGLVLIYPD